MDRIMIIKIKEPIESSKSIHLLMFHIDPKFSLKCVNDSGHAGIFLQMPCPQASLGSFILIN